MFCAAFTEGGLSISPVPNRVDSLVYACEVISVDGGGCAALLEVYRRVEVVEVVARYVR